MSKNYWCVQRGSFPTVSTGRAGPNQTTAGSEISSSIAPQKADCFPLHPTWLLAASPACMGCCFEPVSCLPKTAFKKLKLLLPKAIPSYSFSWHACWDTFHRSPIRGPILQDILSCVLLAKQTVSKQYIMPAFLQNTFRTRYRIYNPFEDLMLVLLDWWARKWIFLLPCFSSFLTWIFLGKSCSFSPVVFLQWILMI